MDHTTGVVTAVRIFFFQLENLCRISFGAVCDVRTALLVLSVSSSIFSNILECAI